MASFIASVSTLGRWGDAADAEPAINAMRHHEPVQRILNKEYSEQPGARRGAPFHTRALRASPPSVARLFQQLRERRPPGRAFRHTGEAEIESETGLGPQLRS